MIKKIFISLFSILFLINVLVFNISAEEVMGSDTSTDVTESVTDTETLVPSEPSTPETSTAYLDFVAKIEAYASTGYDVTVLYTSDSVDRKGVSTEPYTDTLKFETGFIITVDTSLGVEVYDDPSTAHIEGIRVNGQEVNSRIIPIDLDNPQEYIVEVRLVYSEGLLGTLAKISNGEFDWNTIMQEPVLAMQLVYYAIAALSTILGGFGVLVSKKKKVKTADDIASKVDERVREGCTTFAVAYTDVLKENLVPIFNDLVHTNQAVIKALTLSTSKNKEAPVALLDLLKEVSDVNVEKTIDEAREEVLKNIALTEEKRENIHNVLHNIANGTYQEVHHAQKIKTGTVREVTQTTSEKDETKSLF